MPESAQGKQVRCPSCQFVFTAPAEEGPPPRPEPEESTEPYRFRDAAEEEERPPRRRSFYEDDDEAEDDYDDERPRGRPSGAAAIWLVVAGIYGWVLEPATAPEAGHDDHHDDGPEPTDGDDAAEPEEAALVD